MNRENKFQAMISAATSFINSWAAKDSKVGIVDFDSVGRPVAGLTPINTAESRAQLVDTFNDMDPNGNTNIDAGIAAGIQILEAGGDPEGGRLIVLTDGIGEVGGTTPEVLQKGIIVDSVFIGVATANELLQELSDESGGTTCIVYDVSSTSSLSQCFIGISSTSAEGNIFQVHSKKYDNADTAVDGTVLIDSSIGKDTVFTFTWSYSTVPLDIFLFDPDMVLYCSDASLNSSCQPVDVEIDTAFHIITFTFLGVSKVGRWQYFIQFSNTQTIVATVTSYADEQSNLQPIVVTSSISAKDFTDPTTNLVVYAQVSQGFLPVLDAKVTATITDPNSGPWVLELKDEGAAPDVKASDGVYSRNYLWYSAPGRYSVQVEVESNGTATTQSYSASSTASFNYGYIAPNGSVVLNENSAPNTNNASVEPADVGAFQRIASPKAFEYKGTPIDHSTTDLFPPSKIIDLTAVQRNISDISDGFRVSFHAPGDDLDNGKASFYDMRYTLGSSSDLKDHFDSQTPVTATNIVEGTLVAPKQAGDKEDFVLRFDDVTFENDTTSISIAIRAHDDSNNTAEVSNIARINVFVVPPKLNLVPTPTTTMATTTTATTVPMTQPTETSEQLSWLAIVGYILAGLLPLITASAVIYWIVTRYKSYSTKNKVDAFEATTEKPDSSRSTNQNKLTTTTISSRYY